MNFRLRQLGNSCVNVDIDDIIDVDYSGALRTIPEGIRPRELWERLSDRDLESLKAKYEVRREENDAVLRDYAWNSPTNLIGQMPGPGVDQAGRLISLALREAHEYRSDKSKREAVWRTVLDALPDSGRITVLAHSLGSVVIVDLLKRLPADVSIDLLITMGSPLSTPRLWPNARNTIANFPYDRVDAWINLYGPMDIVTAGRGISVTFPQAIDVPVDVGASHEIASYCAHPAVAAAIAQSWFSESNRAPSSNVPAKSIDDAWNLQLLGFAFTNQLSITCPTRFWKYKSRLDAARQISAVRLTTDVGRLREAPVSDAELPIPPTVDDLLHNASDLVRDKWRDEELVPFCVSLYMSPPVPPFDIDVDDEQRVIALASVLDRIRVRSGNLTDSRFAKEIHKAVKEAQDALGSNNAKWGVLVGVGALLLAVTGVGLLAVVPAGLAGAAAITATLAAFGPGGMVGGMLTIAAATGAATGAGTALVSAGAAGSAASRQEASTNLFVLADAMSKSDSKQLRAVLTGMLAVVEAQSGLGFRSSSLQVEQLLLRLESQLAQDSHTHEAIAPGRAGTKEQRVKLGLARDALTWLRPRINKPVIEARESAIRSIESGEK